MKTGLKYAQILRSVGQMLEALEVQSFILNIEGEDLTVSAQVSDQRRLAGEKSLRVFWQRLRGKQAEARVGSKPSSGVVELRYTAADIARMESEGRSRRGAPGAPEAHSVSQVLRAVGGFVDQQSGQLLSVRKQNHNIEFEYQSLLRNKVCEHFTVATLYDYWVKMYMNRRGRAGAKGP